MMRFDFVYGYAQILITEGFHQFYNCKSVRRGAPGTSTPTRFASRHFVRANPPINQNLTDKLMFIGELWLFANKRIWSNAVGGDVLDAPKPVNFDFAYGYAQTYVAKGFHQFCDCKIARYGASRTSPPTRFASRHFVRANTPTNQNLNGKLMFSGVLRLRKNEGKYLTP